MFLLILTTTQYFQRKLFRKQTKPGARDDVSCFFFYGSAADDPRIRDCLAPSSNFSHPLGSLPAYRRCGRQTRVAGIPQDREPSGRGSLRTIDTLDASEASMRFQVGACAEAEERHVDDSAFCSRSVMRVQTCESKLKDCATDRWGLFLIRNNDQTPFPLALR